jgi:periplasmic protein TonB
VRDPLLRSFSSLSTSTESWFERVRENIRQLLTPSNFRASSANGAPIHLLRFEKSARPAGAQSVSLLSHAAAIGILVFLATRVGIPTAPVTSSGRTLLPYLNLPSDLAKILRGKDASSGSGSGGGNTPVATTSGNLAPRSSIQIVKPSLPQDRETILPVAPTILDESAPAVLPRVNNLGLPWMANPTNSPGPGKGNTIGNGRDGQMGDTPGDFAGNGDRNEIYRPGGTMPTCAYCPNPQYTDEARESKLQGTVLLEVLVGADGRASEIRVSKGMGMGLDERAVQSVRTWHFNPARNAGQRAVAAWVTVEAVFRLF